MTTKFPIAAIALGWAATAGAADKTPCPAGMICASAPTTIGAALMKAGYQGLITKDDGGDPEIDSAAQGYEWQVYFYDCEQHERCGSVQFYISFKTDPSYSVALANKWNQTQRLGKMAITDKGGMRITYDLTTVGGLSPANFSDTLAWWTLMVGSIDKFLDAEKDTHTPAKPATASKAGS